jgi:hypothetical protein
MAKKDKTNKAKETKTKKRNKPVVSKALRGGRIHVLISDVLESQPIPASDNAAEFAYFRSEPSSVEELAGAEPYIQYNVYVQNTSSEWTIVGWSYSQDPAQIWKALKAGWVYPYETGLVLTRENHDAFEIYFIARKNPSNPTDPVCYSPGKLVEPDPRYPGSTIPWSVCRGRT